MILANVLLLHTVTLLYRTANRQTRVKLLAYCLLCSTVMSLSFIFLEKSITLLLESNIWLQNSWGCQLEQSVKGWQAKDPSTTKLNFIDVIMSLSYNLQAGSSAYWGYDSRHMIDKCLWLTDHLPHIKLLYLIWFVFLPSLHLEESDAVPPPVLLLLNSQCKNYSNCINFDARYFIG